MMLADFNFVFVAHTHLQDTVVIDSTGEWLHSWKEECRQLGVEHLRTPITLHPAAAPLELRSFIDKHALHHVSILHMHALLHPFTYSYIQPQIKINRKLKRRCLVERRPPLQLSLKTSASPKLSPTSLRV